MCIRLSTVKAQCIKPLGEVGRLLSVNADVRTSGRHVADYIAIIVATLLWDALHTSLHFVVATGWTNTSAFKALSTCYTVMPEPLEHCSKLNVQVHCTFIILSRLVKTYLI